MAENQKCWECGKAYDPEACKPNEGYTDTFCSLKCSARNWRVVAGIPSTFSDTDLVRLNRPEQVAKYQEWARERNCFRGIPGLLHHGVESGTGKTRLGTYAAIELASRRWMGPKEEAAAIKDGGGSTGIWLNVNRFRMTYGSILRDSEAKAAWQQELSTSDILFLDDIDKLKPSEGLMELVFAVFDDRLTSGRTTISTTNLTGELLAKRWGDEVGPYLVRRLRDYSLTIDFDL